MSFSALKKQYLVNSDTNRFRHITDTYEIPEGWYNVDLPEHRIYRNDLFPGEEFFSATTMLGKIAKMKGEDKWLDDWRKRVGDEEADRISKEATDRGTAMHQNLQDYVENAEVRNEHHSGYMLFEKIRPWCDDRITAVIASEKAMCSRLMRVAGRTDLIALLDGDPTLTDVRDLINSGVETLVDFKSSRKVKEWKDIGGYCRQVTMYSMMFAETTNVHLELAEIWMGCDNNGNPLAKNFEIILGNYRETVIDELAEYWAAVGNPMDVYAAKKFHLG